MRPDLVKIHKAAVRAVTMDVRTKTRGQKFRTRKHSGGRHERRAAKAALRKGDW